MLLKVAAARELFVAILAGEGLLARVDALVPNQVGHLAEGLAAARMLALIGLLAVVNASVLLQRRVLCEGLITLLTLEGPVLIMCALMLL